jgi:cell shape-determining protein MreC
MPQPGLPVQIDYLGSTVTGTVSDVADDGHRLEVITDEGASVTFTLNRATATFIAGGGQTGPRLRFTTARPETA